MQRLQNRVAPLAIVALLSITCIAVVGSGASADEETGGEDKSYSEESSGSSGDGLGISSLDDLIDLPCNTGSDTPGSVRLDYGPRPTSQFPSSPSFNSEQSEVRIFCQVGRPTLTIGFNRLAVPPPVDSPIDVPALTATGGQVVANPPGTVCDSDATDALTCAPIEYEDGATVTLTVLPNAISEFDGWSQPAGTCEGTTSPCTITMDRDTAVTAIFGQRSSL